MGRGLECGSLWFSRTEGHSLLETLVKRECQLVAPQLL